MFSPRYYVDPKMVRDLLHQFPLPLYRFCHARGDWKRATIALHFVVVPPQARITTRIILQAVFWKVECIFCS